MLNLADRPHFPLRGAYFLVLVLKLGDSHAENPGKASPLLMRRGVPSVRSVITGHPAHSLGWSAFPCTVPVPRVDPSWAPRVPKTILRPYVRTGTGQPHVGAVLLVEEGQNSQGLQVRGVRPLGCREQYVLGASLLCSLCWSPLQSYPALRSGPHPPPRPPCTPQPGMLTHFATIS